MVTSGMERDHWRGLGADFGGDGNFLMTFLNFHFTAKNSVDLLRLYLV